MINETVGWFANSGNASFAAFLVSVVSIIIASIALYKSSRTQKQQLAIEEKREHDRLNEMRKADLVAQLVPKFPGSNDYSLRIENKGLAEAHDITILIDNVPILEHPAIPQGLNEIRQIGPKSHFQYIMAISMSMCPPFEITINWSDDSEEPGFYRSTVTV